MTKRGVSAPEPARPMGVRVVAQAARRWRIGADIANDDEAQAARA